MRVGDVLVRDVCFEIKVAAAWSVMMMTGLLCVDWIRCRILEITETSPATSISVGQKAWRCGGMEVWRYGYFIAFGL